ncbi:hypothetical protein PMAYCL1PPCAC_10263 [Pristionchus mayeri]|uniref:Uncharacterized protein n=1 Tax=Pristionchus mayeri TaxID=1317129 RepID=A0AAN5C787_9BILA|nr:hypothetical protein PMAYCL1PPCAC_10263 [Pristionchus mayeri]
MPAPRCCCGAMSVVTGSQVLATIMILSAIGPFVYAAVPEDDSSQHVPTRIAAALGSILEVAIATLVLLGCKKYQSSFLRPVLVYVMVALVLLIIFIFTFIVLLLTNYDDKEFAGEALAYCIVEFAFKFWYLTVFHNCYKHFKEVERY